MLIIHICFSAPPASESSAPLTGPGVLTKKKNFKIWFSPKSRKVRCRVETQTDSGPSARHNSDTNVLSVFNFTSSSQDSGSSTPPMATKGAEKTKKKKTERKKQMGVIRKQTRSSRIQSKEKMRLKAVNQQWGLGKDDLLQDKEDPVKQNEARSGKRVSFRCPSDSTEQVEDPQDEKQVLSSVKRKRSILKDTTKKTQELPQAHSETPLPSAKRSEPHSPHSTPKRPRLSPGQKMVRRRRSGSSPNISPCSSIAERKEKDNSPGTGRSLPSPAHMKRNHKGETPLHLAAIKVGFL